LEVDIAATIANSVSIANTAITPKTMTMKTLEMFQQTSVRLISSHVAK
jgi:hypothetical protein